MTDTLGWAALRRNEWVYRCPDHPPWILYEALQWEPLRRFAVMDQGPPGKVIDETPPLCEICGVDLRNGTIRQLSESA